MLRGTITVDSHTRHYVAPMASRDGAAMASAVRSLLISWAWPAETWHFHQSMNERATVNLELLGCPVWEDL